MNTDKPTLDQVITYLIHRLDGMTMPGAVRMTTAARDYLVELQAENEKLRGYINDLETQHRTEMCENGYDCVELGKLRAELEQVKAERDAAISDLETIMAYGGGNLDTCQYCKNGQCYARGGTKLCLPQWRGQKEG